MIEKLEDCYLDPTTGLEWALGTAGPMTWYDAMKRFDGSNGWRLPTIKELLSIIDYEKGKLSIDADIVLSYYWSSTTLADYTGHAWGVSLRYGYVYFGYKTGTYCVLPVRAGVKLPTNVKTTQKLIHENAVAHGWYDRQRSVPELLCLVHSEVSEALEAYRDRNDDLLAEELADVAIRLLDMAEYLGIDLEQQIIRKHNINLNRPYRHGNKRA